MDKEIVIKYRVNAENLLKVSKYILLNSKLAKYIIFGLPLLILLNIFSNSTIENKSDYTNYISLILVILFWGFLYYRTIKETKKKILENQRNFENIKITLDNSSFTQEGQTFTVQTLWKNINKIKETKEWFLIFQTKTTALPIFKKDLSDEQLKDLKELFISLNVEKKLL
ncbi:YcxB family protein [Flavobacterium sp. GCM10023249]|uniref:YcxB family protein n=1 Tax=unclassified Flavobacterium TaxID=196869 RepID=UPI00360BA4DC